MIAMVERMSDSPDRRPDLRISDTDRDRAAEVLREAHAEGRISIDELDERLTSVYNAKTFADLVPVTRDLPAAQDATIAENGALVAYSGEKTGRSPKDKRIVYEETSKDNIWWGSVNIKMDERM